MAFGGYGRPASPARGPPPRSPSTATRIAATPPASTSKEPHMKNILATLTGRRSVADLAGLIAAANTGIAEHEAKLPGLESAMDSAALTGQGETEALEAIGNHRAALAGLHTRRDALALPWRG